MGHNNVRISNLYPLKVINLKSIVLLEFYLKGKDMGMELLEEENDKDKDSGHDECMISVMINNIIIVIISEAVFH